MSVTQKLLPFSTNEEVNFQKCKFSYPILYKPQLVKKYKNLTTYSNSIWSMIR